MLLIVVAQQPAAGVVFVLDGVLIGAGDQDYLALAGLATLAVFGVAAAAVVASPAGWSPCGRVQRVDAGPVRHADAARRGSRWLVTGAVRALAPCGLAQCGGASVPER